MVHYDKKFCLSHSISQEPYIIWLSFIISMYKMIIFPGCFFFFFEIFIFWVVRGVKVQKMVQNDKKFCLLHSVSQEPYIIWLSFMVHLCKMIMFLGCFFFIFSKFWFLGLLGEKNGKKWFKIPYLRNYISYDCHLCYTCLKW